jgi:hypothetical protein
MSWDAAEVFDAINGLSRELGRAPKIAEFLEERRQRNAQGAKLPHLNTIYARFGSWADTVQAAGVPAPQRSGPDAQAQCLESLLACAGSLGKDSFTTTEYDSWRAGSTTHWSSSVVRKWFGPWPNALSALADALESRRASLSLASGARSRLSPLAA